MDQTIREFRSPATAATSPIHRLRVAVLEAWALWVALEVGLFEHLVEPRRAVVLAAKLDFDPSALAALLEALQVTGYLERVGPDEFVLVPGQYPHVLRSSPTYIGPAFGFLRTGRWFEQYPELLRRGGGISLPDEVWVHVIRGSSAYTRPAVDALFAGVPSLCRDNMRVLDVGCGQGDYAALLSDRNPGLQILAIDPTPHVAEVAARRLADKPNVEVRCCSVEEVSGKFDVVLLNHIIHVVGRRQSLGILRACGERLAPGGAVLVQELLETKVNSGALFGLMMRLLFPEGEVLTGAQFDEHLSEAGFEHEPVMIGEGGSGLIIVRASKRAGGIS